MDRSRTQAEIACSGQGVAGKKGDWLTLANRDTAHRNGMERLYELFEKAPHLGSLIDPPRQDGDLFTARHAELDAMLRRALAKHARDTDLASVRVAAQGTAAAADSHTRQDALVVTNVPYLGRSKRGEAVKESSEAQYAIAKADLAAAFVMRCRELRAAGGSTALVTPLNWLFLTGYKKMREELLERRRWNLVARLGPNAFRYEFRGRDYGTRITSSNVSASEWIMSGIDVSDVTEQSTTAERLANSVPPATQTAKQVDQLMTPDTRIAFENDTGQQLLQTFATGRQGIATADYPRFGSNFWEVISISPDWEFLRAAVEENCTYGGREAII